MTDLSTIDSYINHPTNPDHIINVYKPTAKIGFTPTEQDVLIRLKNDVGGDDGAWNWCKHNVVPGTWRALIPLNGPSATYVFNNELDALAFKLQFPG